MLRKEWPLCTDLKYPVIRDSIALIFFRGVTMSITEVIGMILPFIVLTVWVVIDYIRRNK